MRIIQRASKSLGMLEARATNEPALHPRGAETCREDLCLLLSCGMLTGASTVGSGPHCRAVGVGGVVKETGLKNSGAGRPPRLRGCSRLVALLQTGIGIVLGALRFFGVGAEIRIQSSVTLSTSIEDQIQDVAEAGD